MRKLFLALSVLLAPGCVVQPYRHVYGVDPAPNAYPVYYYENDGTWVEEYWARNGQHVLCRHHRYGMICYAR